MSPANSILTDPGPLHPGEIATLNCAVNGGNVLVWGYDGMEVARLTVNDVVGPVSLQHVGGITFIIAPLSSGSNILSSQIIFTVNLMMNGRNISCVSLLSNGSLFQGSISLHITSMYS